MNGLHVQCSEFPLGAHLVAPRGEYEHHGIYVGEGKVVHYAGFCEQWRRGPIEEVSLARFAAGREISVKRHASMHYTGAQVVTRARSRLGENRYRLLTNNCEHFCTWCVDGCGRSEQLKDCFMRPRLAAQVIGSLLKGYCSARFPALMKVGRTACRLHGATRSLVPA